MAYLSCLEIDGFYRLSKLLVMINRKLGFIFIHCQKCAGESIELALTGKINNGFKGDPFEGSPHKHERLSYYKKNYKKEFKTFFKFTVVRNPFDRFISWVKYRDLRYGLYNGNISRDSLLKEIELEMYKKNTYKNLLNLSNRNLLNLSNRKLDELDFIARFENIENDFKFIKKKLSISADLSHMNKSSNEKVHYSKYYNDELIYKVGKVFKFDLDYFRYKFEEK